jgi:predicted sulfurtransferase
MPSTVKNAPSDVKTYHLTAFYLLVEPASPISKEQLESWKEQLDSLKAIHPELCGTFILAPDGINVNVGGWQSTVEVVEGWVEEHIARAFQGKIVGGCSQAEGTQGPVYFKRSVFDPAKSQAAQPFLRWKVQIRRETITSGVMGSAEPNLAKSTHLTPTQWNEKIEQLGERAVLLDTRNDYEYAVGTFRGALNPNTRNFTDLIDYVDKLEVDKEAEILAFCTGGIRCEKAVPYLKSLGYKNVYQLEGGILGYLEHYPNGYFEGDCFVFDQRVAVDGNLQPSGRYLRCERCGQPYIVGSSCCN